MDQRQKKKAQFSRAYLLDRICVMFGGRVAEETARQMVTHLGMNGKLVTAAKG